MPVSKVSDAQNNPFASLNMESKGSRIGIIEEKTGFLETGEKEDGSKQLVNVRVIDSGNVSAADVSAMREFKDRVVQISMDGEVAVQASFAEQFEGRDITFIVRSGDSTEELSGRIRILTATESEELHGRIDFIFDQVVFTKKSEAEGLKDEKVVSEKKSVRSERREQPTPSEIQVLKIINELGKLERKAMESIAKKDEENKVDANRKAEKREFDKTMEKMLNVSQERNFALSDENLSEIDASDGRSKANQAEVDDTQNGTEIKRRGMVDESVRAPKRARTTRFGT